MAIQLFDLRVSDDGVNETQPLSVGDRNRLYQKPDIKDHKDPKGSREVLRDNEEANDSPPQLSIGEIPTAYGEIIETSKRILATMRERIGDLPMYVDPQQRPELAAAISALFGEVNNRVTYSMYQQVRGFANDISLDLADGITNGD